MVKTPRFLSKGTGSTSCWGTKIPHSCGMAKKKVSKKKKKKEKQTVENNGATLFRMAVRITSDDTGCGLSASM